MPLDVPYMEQIVIIILLIPDRNSKPNQTSPVDHSQHVWRAGADLHETDRTDTNWRSLRRMAGCDAMRCDAAGTRSVAGLDSSRARAGVRNSMKKNVRSQQHEMRLVAGELLLARVAYT